MTTNTPIAYLLTLRAYGTWLHGDARGSHDRYRCQYGTPPIAPSARWHALDTRRMSHPSIVWDLGTRALIERVTLRVCEHNGWMSMAVNARSNHLHTVVDACCAPERIVGAIKSWVTRRLREAGLVAPGARVWSRHASTIYLWTPKARDRAIDYVLNRQ